MTKALRVKITPENDIPAFAGYLSGSTRDPQISIVVNIEAMVNAVADKENEITFEEIFTTSVVHELLHAFQEVYEREFDEEEVEKVLEEATKLFYEL